MRCPLADKCLKCDPFPIEARHYEIDCRNLKISGADRFNLPARFVCYKPKEQEQQPKLSARDASMYLHYVLGMLDHLKHILTKTIDKEIKEIEDTIREKLQ